MNSGNLLKIRLLSLFVALISISLIAQTKSLPRSTPEQEGISSESIVNLIDAFEKKIEFVHSYMIVKNGKVVSEGWWEPYGPNSPHELWSLSKSFTSTAIGFAVEEGLLEIHDFVKDYFPEKSPENPSWQLKQLRIIDLLTMSTGHTSEPRLGQSSDDWVKVFMESELKLRPGTYFMYNTPASYMLSAIIQKITGEKLVDYLYPRLFEPLGIDRPEWEMDPKGINTGGWGLHLTTEDIAKFGLFYIQEGKWNGNQLLSEKWIKMATSKQVSNGSDPDTDWSQGYGFQFWRSRFNTYRGDGAMGQFCLVIPEHNTVVAITSGTGNMGGVMEIVWDELLPKMSSSEMTSNPKFVEVLRKKSASLELESIKGKMSKNLAKKFFNKKIKIAENEENVEFVFFNNKKNEIEIKVNNKVETIPFGFGKYIKSQLDGHLPFTSSKHKIIPESSLRYKKNKKIAASGAWISDDKFQLRVYQYETPSRLDYIFNFKNGELKWDSQKSNALGSGNQIESLKSIL